MVDGSSNAIGQDEDPEPRQLPHQEERDQLECDKGKHPPHKTHVISKEFLDLWVLFCGEREIKISNFFLRGRAADTWNLLFYDLTWGEGG